MSTTARQLRSTILSTSSRVMSAYVPNLPKPAAFTRRDTSKEGSFAFSSASICSSSSRLFVSARSSGMGRTGQESSLFSSSRRSCLLAMAQISSAALWSAHQRAYCLPRPDDAPVMSAMRMESAFLRGQDGLCRKMYLRAVGELREAWSEPDRGLAGSQYERHPRVDGADIGIR